MTVSSVNLPPMHVVDGKSDGTPVKQDDRQRPASQRQETSVPLPPPKGARGKFLANIERANRASGARNKKSTGKTWNAGFAVACELAEAFGTDKLANRLLLHFEEMIGPLATQTQAPTAASLVADAINWLRADGSPGQKNGNVATRGASAPAGPNADLLKKLESLTADNEDSNSLGFYAVMAVMSAVPKLANSIRRDTKEGKIVEASALVNLQVLEFTEHVASLLGKASPVPDNPLNKQLISMARAAMKVPFEYLSGKGMIAKLSTSMNKWYQEVLETEKEESQTQLEKALHSFIETRIQ